MYKRPGPVNFTHLLHVGSRPRNPNPIIPNNNKTKTRLGLVLYGAASREQLLESISNEALRISSAAFKTPIANLQILLNKPPLELRRQEFLLRYYFKLKSHIQNPAYASVVITRLQLYFDCRREGGAPVIMRTQKAIENYNLPTQPVLPYITPSKCSRMVENPEVKSELASFRKYSIPANILKAAALENIST